MVRFKTYKPGVQLGKGIYTLPDVCVILRQPYHRVNTWINTYWEINLAGQSNKKYTWHDGKSRALDFNTLIELVVFAELNDAGVKPKEILKAHQWLEEHYKTSFPFANQEVIRKITTDGRKVYFHDEDDTLTLDGTKQFNLGFIREFFKNIDFGDNNLALRLWPMGRKHAIVVDPHHKMGQPVINGTNIIPETIFTMYKAGESTGMLAFLYEIDEKKVKDAIDFCKNAA